MPDLQRLWRQTTPDDADRYLDEDDLHALERARRGVVVLLVLAGVGVLVSYGSAGFAGLVVSLSVVAVAVLLVLAFGVPAGPGLRRRKRPPLPSFDEPYPTFQQVSERLSWARVSSRHYDVVTRPLLARLMASRLADRHGIDVYDAPEAARAVVGEDVWWWLDMSREPERSSQPPGVDVATLTRVVERLETL